MNNNIKTMLEEKNAKVVDLIRETGLAKSFVYDVMNGNSVPTVKTARLIADFFKVTIDEIFPRQDLQEE